MKLLHWIASRTLQQIETESDWLENQPPAYRESRDGRFLARILNLALQRHTSKIGGQGESAGEVQA